MVSRPRFVGLRAPRPRARPGPDWGQGGHVPTDPAERHGDAVAHPAPEVAADDLARSTGDQAEVILFTLQVTAFAHGGNLFSTGLCPSPYVQKGAFLLPAQSVRWRLYLPISTPTFAACAKKACKLLLNSWISAPRLSGNRGPMVRA